MIIYVYKSHPYVRMNEKIAAREYNVYNILKAFLKQNM